jgi:hypothetical protein
MAFDPKKARKIETKSFMSLSTDPVQQFPTQRTEVGTPGVSVNLGTMQGGGIGPQNAAAASRRVAPMPPIPKGAIFGAS